MNAADKLTARTVIDRLMFGSWQKDFLLPNYTPADWWECDVFELRKSGRWTEYEVKLTFADFKADAAKSAVDRADWTKTQLKHDRLAGSSAGPNQFYFVTPRGMLSDANIPPWAGVMEFLPLPGGRLQIWTYRKAPLRHAGKIGEAVRDHALGVCYWRYHNLRKAGAGIKARKA